MLLRRHEVSRASQFYNTGSLNIPGNTVRGVKQECLCKEHSLSHLFKWLQGTKMPTRNRKGFLLFRLSEALDSSLAKFSCPELGRLLDRVRGSGQQDKSSTPEKRRLSRVEAESINGWKREPTVKHRFPVLGVCTPAAHSPGGRGRALAILLIYCAYPLKVPSWVFWLTFLPSTPGQNNYKMPQ